MKVRGPKGWPSIAATVSSSGAASAGPSTVPQATPGSAWAEPVWTKRAIRTGVEATRTAPGCVPMLPPRTCVPVARSGPASDHGGRRRPARGASFIIEDVASSLSHIPAPTRRRAAATLGLFAVLFVAVGAVAATDASSGVIVAFVVVAFVVAAVLALLGWGVAASLRDDRAEQDLDDAIEQAVLAGGVRMCGCGQEHDPSVLHVPDDPCDRDGQGSGCTHSCETCVLATMRTGPRTAPTVPSADLVGSRPSPRPKPEPSV